MPHLITHITETGGGVVGCMCHDSGSSQLAGLKTLISSPQDRQFSAASQSRLDTSRFPRAARLSGRLSLSVSHPSPPRSHSLFGSKERGKPHPPPVTTGPRPTRKCRFALLSTGRPIQTTSPPSRLATRLPLPRIPTLDSRRACYKRVIGLGHQHVYAVRQR